MNNNLQDKNFLAIVGLIIAQIFWGTSYIITELALRVFPPATLVSIRLTIAAVVLGTIALATGKLVRVPWRMFRWLILAAFCEFYLYFLCEASAVQHVGSMVTCVVLAFIPLLTPFMTYVFIHEKITIMSLVGIVISIGGALMVILEKGKFTTDTIGLVYLGLAMLSAVVYSLVLRRVPEEYNTLSVVFYMLCISLVFFIPTALIIDMDQMKIVFATVPACELQNALLDVTLLALTSSCIAFLFYSYGVRVVGPNRAAVFNNIQPGVTALFVWLLAMINNDPNPMTWVKVVGIGVVIIGMFISQKK